MKVLAMVQMRERRTFTYLLRASKSFGRNRCNIETIPFSITLLPHITCRTNLMLRDQKGRFISYKDKCLPIEITEAVESLKPFPTGE